MNWNAAWREQAWQNLQEQHWDLLVIGGGISGAAILREAARRGWKCLLLEQRDFAYGTSSRSSKMVHGGLRYIAKGQLALTRDSVRERQRLLAEAPGLVEPLPFLFPHQRFGFPGRWLFGGVLRLYDHLAGQTLHRHQPAPALDYLAPGLHMKGLTSASQFQDAVVDDARLVLRVLHEARAAGGEAVNGVRVDALLRDNGRVVGVQAADQDSGRPLTLRTKLVVQATGAWSERLSPPQGALQIRPLRGSHLLLPAWRLPVAQAISFMHQDDGRPVFVFPWEGATVIGTTDLDHPEPLDQEARISPAEVDYLLTACAQVLPHARIGRADVRSCWAGVRPVVGSSDTRKRKPSDEKREHVIWQEPGCVTLAGGKLTTFRLLALEVLTACAAQLGEPFAAVDQPVFSAPPRVALPGLSPSQQRRLAGRHGVAVARLSQLIADVGRQTVGATATLQAELILACEQELVLHLDDLLLRRTRLGLLLAEGGRAELAGIRMLCQGRLGWSDQRWQEEEDRYLALWQTSYSLPQEA